MDKIKKGLGRGLSSFIGETKIAFQKNQIPINDLVPNKYQPRKIFDKNSLEDLTNSIKERRVIEPIIAMIENRLITSGHAKILVGLDNAEFIANKIIEKKLSVRQVESFVKIF